jgi:hypothetical protein
MYLPPPHLTARVRMNSIDPARTAIEAWLGTRVRFSSSSAQPHESQTFRVVSAEAAWIMGSRFLRDLQGISCALIGLVMRRDYRGSKSLSPILDAQNVVGSMAPAPAECKSLDGVVGVGSVLAGLTLPPSLRLGEAAAPPVASRGTPAGRVRSPTPSPSRLGPSPKRREGGKGNLAIQDTTDCSRPPRSAAAPRPPRRSRRRGGPRRQAPRAAAAPRPRAATAAALPRSAGRRGSRAARR